MTDNMTWCYLRFSSSIWFKMLFPECLFDTQVYFIVSYSFSDFTNKKISFSNEPADRYRQVRQLYNYTNNFQVDRAFTIPQQYPLDIIYDNVYQCRLMKQRLLAIQNPNMRPLRDLLILTILLRGC